MNSYEFWNDLDKIFNAVVSYQEKNIEFNKQFINPWVKLGNVFDKQDTNKEVVAHKNAIEIDPQNAQNWYDLANTYVRSGSFDKAIHTYQRAIELGFETGELYKNMALAHFMSGKHGDSVQAFQKSLSLLESSEEKAIVWNHLGNVYRKQNNYEMALQAFQQADHLESGEMPPVASLSPVKEETALEVNENEPVAEVQNLTKGEAVLEEEKTEPVVIENEEQPANEEATLLEEAAPTEPVESLDETEESNHETPKEAVEEIKAEENSEIPEPQQVAPVEEPIPSDEIDEDPFEIAENDIEDETIEKILADLDAEASSEAQTNSSSEVKMDGDPEVEKQEEKGSSQEQAVAPSQPVKSRSIIAFMFENNDEDLESEPVEQSQQSASPEETPKAQAGDSETGESEAKVLQATNEVTEKEGLEVEEDPVTSSLAYTQYEATPSLSTLVESPNSEVAPAAADLLEDKVEEPPTRAASVDQVKKAYSDADTSNSDAFVNTDTKNAHVWNELGTVYFNAGSYDDAIAAFSKAIEMDQKFAWPYSNLALTYVQKGRLAEAILLYQRSIELFTNEREQAVTWNRLGNLYRRLNDYENAIVAYQRADELDPDHTAAYQQSRFSLLGSKNVSQEVSTL